MAKVLQLVEKGLKCFGRGLKNIWGISGEDETMGKNSCYRHISEDTYQVMDKALSMDCVIDEAILDDWRRNVGKIPAESGGMIGSKVDRSKIDLYVFDEHSKNSLASFYYDQESMSIVFRKWKAQGYTTNGFVHSHPIGAIRPSYHDISTALLHMDFFRLDYFMMPIIQSNRYGLFTVYFYIAERVNGAVLTTLKYVLSATEYGYKYLPFAAWREIHSVDELNGYRNRVVAKPDNRKITTDDSKSDNNKNIITDDSKQTPKTNVSDFVASIKEVDKVIARKSIVDKRKLFSKVENLFPESVREKVLVCVGAGGAREFLANMARNGFKNYIIIEHDNVSETNVATQAVYVDEIGRSKVEVIKEELLNINPDAHVLCVDKFLDDDMSDEEFKSYMDEFPNKKPTDYLILGCTDNFAPQERSAALALKYGIPYMAAMMYKGGAGAELIFTYPGVTPSCPRCLIRSRYEQYENGFKNDVGSSNCSYFATSMMNAIKGYIALMILAYKSAPGSEYNDMLDAVKDRNFVWIRLSPSIKESLGIGLFDKAFAGAEKYTFMGEPIWVPQIPDSVRFGADDCKLCGGTGDLRSLINRWSDTRKICVTSKKVIDIDGPKKMRNQSYYTGDRKASGFNAYV